jgi:flagellar biosynthetic protein FliO
VVTSQRKKIGLLCVLIVAGGGWLALASREGGDRAATANGVPPADSTVNAPAPAGTFNPPWYEPNLPATGGVTLGGRELFLKMMFSVGLVIALGVAALYLSRKVLPRVTNSPGKEIRVVETAYLGPRKALHVVEVANQRLLIASTNDSITTLAHLSDAWLDVSRPEVDNVVKA